jgi:hypothetical protein
MILAPILYDVDHDVIHKSDTGWSRSLFDIIVYHICYHVIIHDIDFRHHLILMCICYHRLDYDNIVLMTSLVTSYV